MVRAVTAVSGLLVGSLWTVPCGGSPARQLRSGGLSAKELNAVVALGTSAREPAHCSGVLIDEARVATALHCWRRRGLVVSVGDDPKRPLAQVPARVYAQDATRDLLYLDVELPRQVWSVVEPIPVSVSGAVNDEAVIALGFGSSERGGRRLRPAHPATVQAVDGTTTTIATNGGEGACLGDSGGPLHHDARRAYVCAWRAVGRFAKQPRCLPLGHARWAQGRACGCRTVTS